MLFVLFVLLTVLIPSLQSRTPYLRLKFSPDGKYFNVGNHVDIECKLIHPNNQTDTAQLWHVDLETGRRTAISRTLLRSPTSDSPNVFRTNKNARLMFMKKNYLRIQQLSSQDSARYECNCPDCVQQLKEDARDLQVMSLAQPKWHILRSGPIPENVTITINCTVDNFYPYVRHQILHQHHDITQQGKSQKPRRGTFPQKFSWEANVTTKAEWHNTKLTCIVTQGNEKHHAEEVLEIRFNPRFNTCAVKQYVDSSKEKATIECSYSGNPAPTLKWIRRTDGKSITTDDGVHIEVEDEHHGRYKSIVTFDRDKLISKPIMRTTTTTTTTQSLYGNTDTPQQPKETGENYYQQLLNDGFIAKLVHDNEDKGSRYISISSDANKVRSGKSDNSTIRPIQNLSTPLTLFLLLVILYMIQRH